MQTQRDADPHVDQQGGVQLRSSHPSGVRKHRAKNASYEGKHQPDLLADVISAMVVICVCKRKLAVCYAGLQAGFVLKAGFSRFMWF